MPKNNRSVTFYLEVPEELVEASDLRKTRYKIGDRSFDNFWVLGQGFELLVRMSETTPELLGFVTVKDSNNAEPHDVDEFLNELDELNVIVD